MNAARPKKTAADYMVIAFSPVLIMLLVGSLSFFLVQVFFRGEAVDSVRWVVFWFVLAVVLVTRIGIEQGPGHAVVYGLALAGATWIYLVQVHPAYLLGMALLATIWWCAHKLTRNCTLIDDNDDASGQGLLQTIGKKPPLKQRQAAPEPEAERASTRPDPQPERKRSRAVPHPPGQWVVYFSLAALPLFGVGQMFLPAGDVTSRRAGFVLLFIYLTAAVGLLLTTSFLGLRRYLRQRFLKMPGMIAFGWIKFGVGVAGVVLVATLLLPRPGAAAWKSLYYQIDYRLRQASEFAARINPPGKGPGRPGQPAPNPGQPATSPAPGTQSPAEGHAPDQTRPGNQGPQKPAASGAPSNQTFAGLVGALYNLFRALLLLAGILLLGWWLFRHRELLLQIARSVLEALRKFFDELFQFRPRRRRPAGSGTERTRSRRPAFASYENPFVTGQDRVWSPEQVVLYSYEALSVWAEEHGRQPLPPETAREFCSQLGEQFPEVGLELDRLSQLYGQAAYGVRLPPGCDLEPVRQLWRYLTGGTLASEAG